MAMFGSGGKGTKKYGRNKHKCSRYESEGRREKNKELKAKRHQKRLAKFASEKHKEGLKKRKARNAKIKSEVKAWCKKHKVEYQTSMYLDAKAKATGNN